MASILLVLTSSPNSPPGRRALTLAECLADRGDTLTLCCLQDAVLLATPAAGAALSRLLDRGARCLVLGEDLASRGLKPAAGAAAVDHAGVVGLLAAEPDRVIGAF